jgi:predicted site-specific integrase-resolvase
VYALNKMTDMTETYDTRRAVPLAVIEQEFGVPTHTLARWARNGTLRAFRWHSGQWRVRPQDVADLLIYSEPQRER